MGCRFSGRRSPALKIQDWKERGQGRLCDLCIYGACFRNQAEDHEGELLLAVTLLISSSGIFHCSHYGRLHWYVHARLQRRSQMFSA